MAIFSEFPRKNYIPVESVTLSDYSFQETPVLDHMKATYNNIFNRTLRYTDFMVSDANAGRLDLIAWEVYQSVDMWWVIGYYNGIVNPLFDLTPGKKLKIPSLTDIQFALEVNTQQVISQSRVVDIL